MSCEMTSVIGFLRTEKLIWSFSSAQHSPLPVCFLISYFKVLRCPELSPGQTYLKVTDASGRQHLSTLLRQLRKVPFYGLQVAYRFFSYDCLVCPGSTQHTYMYRVNLQLTLSKNFTQTYFSNAFHLCHKSFSFFSWADCNSSIINFILLICIQNLQSFLRFFSTDGLHKLNSTSNRHSLQIRNMS